ncbi:unnamed protein product, partial [Didymodactylos carnosus]
MLVYPKLELCSASTIILSQKCIEMIKLFQKLKQEIRNKEKKLNDLKDRSPLNFDDHEEPMIKLRLDSACSALTQYFVPKQLGFGHVTRTDGIQNHTRPLAQQLQADDDPTKAIIILDGTIHKGKPFVKPMMIVFSDGYIIAVLGPFFADGKNNDSEITKYLLYNNVQGLQDWMQPGDVVVVDRGFRDCLIDLQKFGYETKMPLFMEKDQTQYTTDEANKTRLTSKLAYNQGGDYHLKHSKTQNVDDEDSHTKQAKLNALYEDSTGKKHELNEENRDHALQKHKEADSELEEKRNKYSGHPHRYAGKGSDSDSSDSNGYGSESRDDKYNRHPHRYAGKGSDSNGYGSESRDDKYNRHPHKHAGKGSDSNDYGNEHRDERVKRGAPEHGYHDSSGYGRSNFGQYAEKKHDSYPESHPGYPAYEHHKKSNYGGHDNWNKKEVHEKKSAQEHKHHKESEDEALKYSRRHGEYAPRKSEHKPYPEKKESYNSKPRKSYKPTTESPTTQKPYQSTTQKPYQPTTQKSYQSTTQKPYQSTTQKPYQPTTEKPYQPTTQKPYQPTTQKPYQPT